MGTIAASAIIDRAESTLLDETNVRWSPTELLAYLSDAQAEIVMLKPDAYSRVLQMKTKEGTKQSIPESVGAILLLDVIRNVSGAVFGADDIVDSSVVGDEGDTDGDPGRVITRINRSDIDSTNPNWHSVVTAADVVADPSLTKTVDSVVNHFVFDERSPTTFYVTPPHDGSAGAGVEIVASVTPSEITSLSSTITLADIYRTPIYYYIMFRAHAKETQASSPEKSAAYYQMFIQSVVGKQAGETNQGS